MTKQLLILFTRNPELGKVKTRLAMGTSDETALEVYKQLLKHTHNITKNLTQDKWVFYTNKIEFDDLWNEGDYKKMIQADGDLGVKMHQAFAKGFEAGYEEIVIIGSDIDSLNQTIIEKAFENTKQEIVLGPAEDGGYYLLGLSKLREDIFQKKEWGTETVFRSTIKDLEHERIYLLPMLNDIDHLEDIQLDSFLYPLVKQYIS